MSEKIKTKHFTFAWKIENYSSCCEKNEVQLSSPLFVAENLNNSQWYLSLYPRGESEQDRDYVSLYLNIIEENRIVDKMLFTFKISISLSDGTVLKTIEDVYVFNLAVGNGGFQMLKTKELHDAMEKSNDDTLVIACHITKNNKSSNKVSSCVGKTRIGVNRYSYFWHVPCNFALESWNEMKQFMIHESYVLEVTLTCPINDILIRISLVNRDIASSMHVICKIVLLDINEVENCSQSDAHLFKLNEAWSFPSFFSKEQLMMEKDNYILKNTFSLVLYFSTSGGEKIHEIEQFMHEESTSVHGSKCGSHLTALCNDFQNMLKEKEHCDMQIQVCDQSIPAHKCVLSSRSPVFRTMFEQNMTEAKTGIVKIIDHDVITVQYFLDFVYAGSFDNMDIGLALELLIMADKYKVSSLEKKCTSFLELALSEENVCEILKVSDLMGDKTLKKSTINFITSHSRNILLSSQWSALVEENCKLGSEVLSKLSKKFGTM